MSKMPQQKKITPKTTVRTKIPENNIHSHSKVIRNVKETNS